MTAMIDNKSQIMMTTTTTIVVMKDTPTPGAPVPFISHPSSSMNDTPPPPPPPPHTHTHIEWRVAVCACRRWCRCCRRNVNGRDVRHARIITVVLNVFRRLVFVVGAVRGVGVGQVGTVGVSVYDQAGSL